MLIRWTPGPVHKPAGPPKRTKAEANAGRIARLEAEIARETAARDDTLALIDSHDLVGKLTQVEGSVAAVEAKPAEAREVSARILGDAALRRSEAIAIQEAIEAAKTRLRHLEAEVVGLERQAAEVVAAAEEELRHSRAAGAHRIRDEIARDVARMRHRQRKHAAEASDRIEKLTVRLGRIKLEVEGEAVVGVDLARPGTDRTVLHDGDDHRDGDPVPGAMASEVDG
jgi:hypothetical protein